MGSLDARLTRAARKPPYQAAEAAAKRASVACWRQAAAMPHTACQAGSTARRASQRTEWQWCRYRLGWQSRTHGAAQWAFPFAAMFKSVSKANKRGLRASSGCAFASWAAQTAGCASGALRHYILMLAHASWAAWCPGLACDGSALWKWGIFIYSSPPQTSECGECMYM